MKGLSLWQPWASAIAFGLKSIETRSWSTSYRGLIAIHAAMKWTRQQEAFFNESPLNQILRQGTRVPLGAIVAVVKLVDVRPVEELILDSRERRWGDYSPGRFGWTMVNLLPLIDPIPFAGRQGLFDLPLGVAHKVIAQAGLPLSNPDPSSETPGEKHVSS